MGNICSTCAKKKKAEDKYKTPVQDAENQDGITIATNHGGTMEKKDLGTGNDVSDSTGSSVPKPSDGQTWLNGPREPDASMNRPREPDASMNRPREPDASMNRPREPDASRNRPKEPDAGKRDAKNSDPGPKVKKKKTKKREPETDSSDSSSSDTSSSSDSDRGGYQRSSRKAYKNKQGGTTIVSKNTIVGGNYMKIGEGAKNVVLTINNAPAPTRAPTSAPAPKPPKPEVKTRYEPYNAKTSAKFKNTGQFVYISGTDKGRFEGIDVGKLRMEAEQSICRIQYPGGSGSGFRVGFGTRNLLCTAYHVVEEILGKGGSVFDSSTDRQKKLESGDVWCIFNHILDGANLNERDKFYFKPVLHYFDDETDVAILELKDNGYFTKMPPPFKNFNVPEPTEEFYLIGHPYGGKKVSYRSENIINVTSPNTSNHINIVRRWCHDNNMVCEANSCHTLDNPARWLFDVGDNFTKGASGCPGLVIKPPHTVFVVTILLRGYPDGFYDEKIPFQTRARLPQGYRVEQGANMEYVYENMKSYNLPLCKEVFDLPKYSIPVSDN